MTKQTPPARLLTALTLAALAWNAASCRAAAPSPGARLSPTASVNPFVGTAGHGHTYPGATTPFGWCSSVPTPARKAGTAARATTTTTLPFKASATRT